MIGTVESSQTVAVPLSEKLMSAPTREGVFLEVELRWAGLNRSSGTFRAAAIVVAARRVGQNVDKLARFCGFEREFVARCTRRLCDSGLWGGGTTRSAEASTDELWIEVEVAEGKLCRRVDEAGDMHWEPQGQWRKTLEEALAEAAEAALLAMAYAEEEEEGEEVDAGWRHQADKEVRPLRSKGLVRTPAPAIPVSVPKVSIPTWQARLPAAPTTVIADVFPGALWLG
jgi:hypothetical protein